MELDNILRDLGNQTLDLVKSYIAIEGGFIVSSYPKLKIDQNLLDSEATMGYSLFKTADKCSWLLKKMHVNSILLECVDRFQFINKVDSNIFSIEIGKGRQKLGLLRLIIPRYCKKITRVLKEARRYEIEPVNLNLEKLFTELIF
jgi:predicted regulator of Ras-like GTPase activity (Roadblock/LC7/MglB family)